VRDISEIFVYNRGFFEVGLLNDAKQILLRPTPVAMAPKFGTVLTRPHSDTLGSKTANINVKKLTSLKLIVRTM